LEWSFLGRPWFIYGVSAQLSEDILVRSKISADSPEVILKVGLEGRNRNVIQAFRPRITLRNRTPRFAKMFYLGYLMEG